MLTKEDLRYCGNETGDNGKMTILIDETELAKVNNFDRWSRNEFVDEEYTVPGALVKGNKTA